MMRVGLGQGRQGRQGSSCCGEERGRRDGEEMGLGLGTSVGSVRSKEKNEAL